MDEITLYLGTLAAIGIGGLVLIVILLTRGSGGGRKSQQQLRSEYRSVAVPRVQVVLGEPDEGLIWVVNGRATRDLATISDPTERRAIELLLERVQAVELPMVPSDELGIEITLSDSLALSEPGRTATHSLPPSQEGELGTQEGTSEISPSEVPVIPASPSPARYEDELTRPFLARLRDSLFGVDYESKPSQRMYSPRPLSPASKGKAKESVEPPVFGIPRFEELNTLLQQRLAATPDAPPTTIRVGREGMIEILVQGRVYDHIDDVPDDSVRQAMREAVAIWNQR
jgi:hypothetical protein